MGFAGAAAGATAPTLPLVFNAGALRGKSQHLVVGRTFVSAAYSYPARHVPVTRSFRQLASVALSATLGFPWPASSGPFFAPGFSRGEKESTTSDRALQRRFSNQL